MDLQALSRHWADQTSQARAIVLFGSRARGDWNNESDIDVAVLCEANTTDDLIALKSALLDRCTDHRVQLSVYSTRTAHTMAADGSLFMWHLRLEGLPLWERAQWWTSVSHSIRPYTKTKARRDLATFDAVLSESCEALDSGRPTLLFEAATVFAALRGIGMIVSMLQGRPCFSRASALATINTFAPSTNISADDVRRLEKAKLLYSRKSDVGASDELEAHWCRRMASHTRWIIRHANQFIDSTDRPD